MRGHLHSLHRHHCIHYAVQGFVTINPQGAHITMKPLLTSRKFWAALVGLILVVLHNFVKDLPLSDQAITDAVYILVAYILGTGLSDINA
jgi:hypothetical protein